MAIQPVTIIVGGKEFEGWKACTINKSMLDFNGTFSLLTKTKTNFPFFVGQSCKILLHEKPVINGYIDEVGSNKTEDAHNMSLSGHDKTIDIVQGTCGDTLAFLPVNMTLKQVIERTLTDIGITNIKVIDEVGNLRPFKKTDFVDSIYGDTYFNFLDTYARERQVMLTTDGDSNIVITRTTNQKVLKTILDNDNDSTRLNIESVSANINYSNLFHEYTCQYELPDNLQSLPQKDPSFRADITGTIFDNEIRKTRRYHFQTEFATDSLTAKERAIWQKNYSKAHAISLNYKVDGFIPRNDPELIWFPNYLVVLRDKEVLKSDMRMLIKSVQYQYDMQGSNVTLSLTDPLALSLEEQKAARNADETTKSAQYFRNPASYAGEGVDDGDDDDDDYDEGGDDNGS